MINFKQFNNKKIHQSLRDNPVEAMRAQGMQVDETKEYIVHTNTANLLYIVMPSELITQDDFAQIQAAGRVGTIGTAGSVGSIGSFGTLCTCVGSLGTVSTAASAGCAVGANIKD